MLGLVLGNAEVETVKTFKHILPMLKADDKITNKIVKNSRHGQGWKLRIVQ
jgi:hypothetical protein